MAKPETVALAALARELVALTGAQAPTYRKLWSLTVDGRIPAEQVNGRYQVRRSDLPAIAASLGLGVHLSGRPMAEHRRTAASDASAAPGLDRTRIWRGETEPSPGALGPPTVDGGDTLSESDTIQPSPPRHANATGVSHVGLSPGATGTGLPAPPRTHQGEEAR